MTRRTAMARRAAVVFFLAAVGAAAISTSLASQGSQQVFRGGATLVYVDVYPRKGARVVQGLPAKDFQVFEDGNPQSVQTFEFIKFEPAPFDADRRDPTSVADSERQAADPRNRLFVVYLDIYNATRFGSRDANRPVVDFLTRTIG